MELDKALEEVRAAMALLNGVTVAGRDNIERMYGSMSVLSRLETRIRSAATKKEAECRE